MATINSTSIDGLLIIDAVRHQDNRGFFSEVFRTEWLRDAGDNATFVQDNHSMSRAAGVLRGLHFQSGKSAQGKLVRVTRGSILDVAVDIRVGSPTFGHFFSVELSAQNWRQLWVPIGFAHGFVTLEPDTEVLYKVTALYDPHEDRGLAFDDPAIAIDWRFPVSKLTLSEKDRTHPRLKDLPAYFQFDELRGS